MTRILGIALAAALAAALVPQGSTPAEAAKKKAKNSSAGAAITSAALSGFGPSTSKGKRPKAARRTR